MATDRKYLKKIGQIRRDLIASKALENAPRWNRLWNAHGYWTVQVCAYELRSTAGFARHAFQSRYCRIADRIFGETRYARYQERQRQLAERYEQKADDLQKRLDEREQKNFAREVMRQALTNPNFVVNDHIHQDR